jgi:DNA repair protein SbcD/Mre11
MEKIRFIHTADLHLDTPFKGLSNINKDLAARLKDSTLKSFGRIIDICIREKVDFLLVAGDIFDSDLQGLAAQLRFVNELERLNSAGIPAYIVAGNHDPLVSWMRELKMPGMVHRFPSDRVESIPFMKNDRHLADIYGISFENKSVTHNLAENFSLKKERAPFSIAMLHGTIGSTGVKHINAPFTLDDIRSSGFDYWALGHVHKRQIVNPAFPMVIYPGNPQGRDFGETGPRGCYLIELDRNSAPSATFVPTHFVRFEELHIDLTGLDTINSMTLTVEAAIDSIAQPGANESLMLRITLQGRTPLHALLNREGELARVLEMLNEGQLNRSHFRWIDHISCNTRPDVDLEELRKGNDFPAEILNAFAQYETNAEQLNELIQELGAGLAPTRARLDLDALSEADQLEILQRAKWMLMDQLIKE